MVVTYDTYYKIDLIYNEGGVNKFYHILRNFKYEIELPMSAQEVLPPQLRLQPVLHSTTFLRMYSLKI